jgi:hypothetical protein
MSRQDALFFEELSFDEAPDIMSAMTTPEFRRYVEEDTHDEEALGFRALLESPETFLGSVRPGGKRRRQLRVRRRSRTRG